VWQLDIEGNTTTMRSKSETVQSPDRICGAAVVFEELDWKAMQVDPVANIFEGFGPCGILMRGRFASQWITRRFLFRHPGWLSECV
jgi:hypothetical protein